MSQPDRVGEISNHMKQPMRTENLAFIIYGLVTIFKVPKSCHRWMRLKCTGLVDPLSKELSFS